MLFMSLIPDNDCICLLQVGKPWLKAAALGGILDALWFFYSLDQTILLGAFSNLV